MENFLLKFLFMLAVICAVGWVFIVFVARLVAWILNRTVGISISLQVAGCNRLKDIFITFKKGKIESILIGEVRLRRHDSRANQGLTIFSKDQKLQLLISDFEVYLRSPVQSTKKSKPRTRSSPSLGKGAWMFMSNIAKHLALCVTELNVKGPKSAFQIKGLRVEASVHGESNPTMNLNLQLAHFVFEKLHAELGFDRSPSFTAERPTYSDPLEKKFCPITFLDLSVVCDTAFEREHGVKLGSLDVSFGAIVININESLFTKTKTKPKISVDAEGNKEGASDDQLNSEKSKPSESSVKRHILAFPEKVNFSIKELDAMLMHQGQDLSAKNSVTDIVLRSTKTVTFDDSAEATSKFSFNLDFNKIVLLKEGPTSVMEFSESAFIVTADVPLQPLPIRTEVEVKLGSINCNFIVSRLKPWLLVKLGKQKQMVLREESPKQDKKPTGKMNNILWRSSVSAPEVTIMLYNFNDCPLFHGCFKSSHLSANNIVTKRIELNASLGKFQLNSADVNQQSFEKKVIFTEINSGSLVHLEQVNIDCVHSEVESQEEHDLKSRKLTVTVDMTRLEILFGNRHAESLTKMVMPFKEVLKGSSSSSKQSAKDKVGQSSKKDTSKGLNILKFNLGICSIKYIGDTSLEDMTVADPKRVNFGSQGGQVLITESADGKTREAIIFGPESPDSCRLLNFSTSLDISNLRFVLNKEKHSMQIEVDRTRSLYLEYTAEQNPTAEVTLLDMQKAKFVRRSSGLNDIALCSLLNVTDISVRWEPDAHLAFHQLVTSLKFLLSDQNSHSSDHQKKEKSVDNVSVTRRETTSDQASPEKKQKKRDSVFAVDVEKLRVSAELADGVEAIIYVQSIFSENAKIGVLFEEVNFSFNEARIFRTSRMQVSRIPVSATQNLQDSKSQTSTWDWVIRSPDIYVCMPYRLQLRAIDDAVEDTLRGLKLISAAKMNLISPGKKSSTKKSKSKSTNFGSVRLLIRKLTVEIEEEPIQGWLDEHYHLMKKEVCKGAVRLKFLDELLSSSHEQNAVASDAKIHYNGIEIDPCDTSSVELLRTEIHEKVFRSYYEGCQKIIMSEGSGVNTKGFQSGFRLSTARTSLLSVCARELDVTLTKIDKGSIGMIEFIKKVDPVCSEKDIPFSRLYGSDFVLNAESLVVDIRNYTYPIFGATSAKCQGRVVIAQQATSFQPQIVQDTFVGRWWRVRMLRSASGTTPPNKVYLDLPISFQKGEVSFGVGHEPVFADISYAFTVALRRANLETRSCTDQSGLYISQTPASSSEPQVPKKERSLPWWDEIRNYVHGKIGLSFVETRWFILGTADPYEKHNKLEIVSANMEIQQSDGRIYLSAKEFKIFLSSLKILMETSGINPPSHLSGPFLSSSTFIVEVLMEWGCESGNPLDHYLYSLPVEGKPRMKVFDPFRSTALALKWDFSLNNSQIADSQLASSSEIATNTKADVSTSVTSQTKGFKPIDPPTINLSAHDLAWLIKFSTINYLPPHKIRMFSRWPRFGVPRVVRSGNLSLDRVMTEFFLRIDMKPLCIYNKTLREDDPSNGVAIKMEKFKFDLCFSRGKQEFTFECNRPPLDLVYQGIDLHMLTVYIDQINRAPIIQDTKTAKRSSRSESVDKFGNENCNYGSKDKRQDDGFLLLSDYFTVRKQTSKADPARLLEWQEYGRKDHEVTYAASELENKFQSDHARSELIEDDGFNVIIADSCQRVFVYGLKILWTLENRIAVTSLARGLTKIFQPPKPSPSKLYAQRKLLERQQKIDEADVPQDVESNTAPNTPPITPCECSTSEENIKDQTQDPSSIAPSTETVKQNNVNNDEEGRCHFMVNVIQPQFNLHSEEAKGRFLLAAASGRVLARSFHSIVQVRHDMLEQALTGDVVSPDNVPEMTWKRMELSMMLEHVQAHVAPTDIDPGAGIQWLPKILRESPNVKRTGPLLERVFMPCQMYFQYTQYKGGTPELKVKPLKELTFNSPNITSEMTSRQFRVMLDVLTNLLFARLPKPPQSSDENDDTEYEADKLVPDGVEEVDLARINLEQRRREHKLFLRDIKTLAVDTDVSDVADPSPEKCGLWMVACGTSALVQELKKDQGNICKAIKEASSALRSVLQEAVQQRLLEKEKNKIPSCAVRVFVRISKVVWSMLIDDKPFAESEINDMIYDFDRDYKDIGMAQFTTKSIVIRNCVPNAKSDTLLSAWNAPTEWGKRAMLHVNAKQGAPKDGKSLIEHFQVEIYPLRIHLTETMYNMMWQYIFPEEEQDSQRRQEVWKVSTTGAKRGKKGLYGSDAIAFANLLSKEPKAPGKSAAKAADGQGDIFQMRKTQNPPANAASSSTPELRRSSSHGRTWEETVADSVANEVLLQVHSSQNNPLNAASDNKNPISDESKNKAKDPKTVKSGQFPIEEKKAGKTQDVVARPKKSQEFRNVRISQVELLVTYEGSRIAVSDFRLLMDTFHREEFTGTWRRLFARVKKHIVWGVLKSVAGMQGKKFKDKTQNLKEVQPAAVPETDVNMSDSDGEQRGKSDQLLAQFPKKGSDGGGDGFVTSIRGLFNTQRKKAKAYVLRTMRGDGEQEHGEWSDGDAEFVPFARQLTIAKTKKLIRRHSKKFNSKGQNSEEQNDDPLSPKDEILMAFESDSSEASSGEDNEYATTNSSSTVS